MFALVGLDACGVIARYLPLADQYSVYAAKIPTMSRACARKIRATPQHLCDDVMMKAVMDEKRFLALYKVFDWSRARADILTVAIVLHDSKLVDIICTRQRPSIYHLMCVVKDDFNEETIHNVMAATPCDKFDPAELIRRNMIASLIMLDENGFEADYEATHLVQCQDTKAFEYILRQLRQSDPTNKIIIDSLFSLYNHNYKWYDIAAKICGPRHIPLDVIARMFDNGSIDAAIGACNGVDLTPQLIAMCHRRPIMAKTIRSRPKYVEELTKITASLKQFYMRDISEFIKSPFANDVLTHSTVTGCGEILESGDAKLIRTAVTHQKITFTQRLLRIYFQSVCNNEDLDLLRDICRKMPPAEVKTAVTKFIRDHKMLQAVEIARKFCIDITTQGITPE